jgi:hypothetical protein
MTVYLQSLAGGVLIGTSAAALLLFLGRIAGISGIIGGLLQAGAGERLWRACFVGGLLAGGVLLHAADPTLVAYGPDRSLATIGLAGLLVGYGTRLGSGCTSGHGVCGVGRGSPRSIVATLVFVGVGMATVLATRLVWGTT